MKKIFTSTVLSVLIGIVALCSMVYAEVGIRHGGVLQFESADIDLGTGLNWENIQGVAFIHGVNWQNVTGISISQINWTGANILNSGVNWESVRVANGNTSSSINWQAFGV